MTKIGVVGGGQLARMMIPAAINLGIDLQVFAEAEQSPASMATTLVGDFRDTSEVVNFSQNLDVLTFDHEHVPTEVLREVENTGVPVFPSADALTLTHNKIVMRERLEELGAPQPRWTVISEQTDRESALAEVGGFPCVAKKPVGGYDGKGVRVVESWSEIEDWLAEGSLLLEEKVPFTRELALLSARRPGGEWLSWTPVETRQKNGVCSEVIAPAPDLDPSTISQSTELAGAIAEGIGIVGVLAVEVFQLPDGSLVVNELAMRPHNSGHVFTELSQTSQFEQHLRAVADLPLGATDLLQPRGVMVNLFGGIKTDSKARAWTLAPEAKIHDYGKSPRPGRKVGHVVVVGADAESLLARAEEVRQAISASS